jgi:ABC-2 type transport system permease protein
MRTFLVLLSREIRSFFHTPIAYVVMVFFLGVLGFGFYLGVAAINGRPSFSVTVIELLFGGPFWAAYLLCVSLISMRSFSDEFRMGTLETLTTAPVKDWQVVLAKYFGVLCFYVTLFLPTLLFFAVLSWVSGGVVDLHSIGTFGSAYLILFLFGTFYVSVGCFASSLVKDQVNAAIISFAISVVYIFLSYLMTREEFTTNPGVRAVGRYLSTMGHLTDACTGRLDTQQLVLYPSLALLMLFATLQVFQFRKWKA